MAIQNKSPQITNRYRWNTRQIPSPSLAGQTVIVVQAVLLALYHRFASLPGTVRPSDILGIAPHYSGGTAPAFNRSSLLSPITGHLHQHIEFFYYALSIA